MVLFLGWLERSVSDSAPLFLFILIFLPTFPTVPAKGQIALYLKIDIPGIAVASPCTKAKIKKIGKW